MQISAHYILVVSHGMREHYLGQPRSRAPPRLPLGNQPLQRCQGLQSALKGKNRRAEEFCQWQDRSTDGGGSWRVPGSPGPGRGWQGQQASPHSTTLPPPARHRRDTSTHTRTGGPAPHSPLAGIYRVFVVPLEPQQLGHST